MLLNQNKSELYWIKNKINFSSIKDNLSFDTDRKIPSYKNWLPNSQIGVIDIETYKNEETGSSPAFGIGFYTFKDSTPKFIPNKSNKL